MAQKSSLIFDPATHQYSVDSAPYTSVTQTLSKLKLTPPYPETDARGLKDLGSAVHKAVELASWDRLDDATTSPALLPYVEGFREKQREMNIRPIATELMLYDPVDGIAGTLDLFCWVYDPADFELAIIDYKRSDSVANCTELQTAGYEKLIREADRRGDIQPVMMHGNQRCALWMGYPIRRLSMKLLEGRSVVKEYRDPHDSVAWSAAVELLKWQQRVGKKANVYEKSL